MIANLFEEYKFFSKYPERQLRIAAVLFGEILFYACSNTSETSCCSVYCDEFSDIICVLLIDSSGCFCWVHS